MNSALYFLYLAFFISHIPITLFVDSQAGEESTRRCPTLAPALRPSGFSFLPPLCSAAGVVVPPSPEGRAVLVLCDVPGPPGGFVCGVCVGGGDLCVKGRWGGGEAGG